MPILFRLGCRGCIRRSLYLRIYHQLFYIYLFLDDESEWLVKIHIYKEKKDKTEELSSTFDYLIYNIGANYGARRYSTKAGDIKKKMIKDFARHWRSFCQREPIALYILLQSLQTHFVRHGRPIYIFIKTSINERETRSLLHIVDSALFSYSAVTTIIE